MEMRNVRAATGERSQFFYKKKNLKKALVRRENDAYLRHTAFDNGRNVSYFTARILNT